MATTYSYSKVVTDTSILVEYIQKSFATLVSASNDGATVALTFSAALTSPEQTALGTLVTNFTNPSSSTLEVAAVSLYNSTSTALASSAVFTGTWEDVSKYGSVTVSVKADQTGSLAIQYGFVSQAADLVKTYAIAANTATVKVNSVAAKWMRVVYTNGSTLQTSFSLQTRWSSTMQQVPIVGGADLLDDNNDFQLTKAVVAGKTDAGNSYSFARIDESNRLRTRPLTSVYGHVNAAPPTAVVRVNFTYNVNAALTSTATTGSGAVTYSTAQAVVSSGAAASSSATLTTDRYVHVLPGQCAYVCVSAVFSTPVANNTQLVGAGTSANGLFFGYNGTSFGVMYRSNSVDTWVAKSAWNVDKLDGTGPSGMTIDPTKGSLYTIQYDASGYGTVVFKVNCTGGTTSPTTVHRIDFGNSLTSPGIRNPCFPCTAISTNTTNTSAKTVSVANFSAFIDGVMNPIGVIFATESTKTFTSATAIPMVTLRNKSTYASLPNTSGIVLRSLSFAVDGNRNSFFTIHEAPTLTGGSYADVSTNTSCADVNSTATALSGGNLIFSATLWTDGDSFIDLAPYEISVPPGSIVTVAAKCLTAGTNLCALSLTWIEFQ